MDCARDWTGNTMTSTLCSSQNCGRFGYNPDCSCLGCTVLDHFHAAQFSLCFRFWLFVIYYKKIHWIDWYLLDTKIFMQITSYNIKFQSREVRCEISDLTSVSLILWYCFQDICRYSLHLNMRSQSTIHSLYWRFNNNIIAWYNTNIHDLSVHIPRKTNPGLGLKSRPSGLTRIIELLAVLGAEDATFTV